LIFASLAFPRLTRAETNDTNLPPAKLERDAAADTMRSYLQLQEQIHTTQLAIERNRQEAEAAAAHNMETLTAQLQAFESALVAQRTRDLEAMQGTNRIMLTVGGTCAAVGFLAMMLTAFFQWRAVSRLTEFSVLSQASLSLGRPALPAPDSPPANSAATEQAQTRLFGALEGLEKRILELEHTAHLPLPAAQSPDGPPAANGATVNPSNRSAVLIAKGDSLLSMDKVEEAIACFDEILALEPDHSEALVRKGDALERLRRMEDAIQCYDRAIAADGSLTVAYLHKGGLFNRMERYEEALQCYEQALRTQEKTPAA
jgi:tetratricopeptide (TPR) repeat protein